MGRSKNQPKKRRNHLLNDDDDDEHSSNHHPISINETIYIRPTSNANGVAQESEAGGKAARVAAVPTIVTTDQAASSSSSSKRTNGKSATDTSTPSAAACNSSMTTSSSSKSIVSKRRKLNSNPFLNDPSDDDDDDENDNDKSNVKDTNDDSVNGKASQNKTNSNMDIFPDIDNDNDGIDNNEEEEEEQVEIKIIPCRRKDCKFIIRYHYSSQHQSQEPQTQIQIQQQTPSTDEIKMDIQEEERQDILLQSITIPNVKLQSIIKENISNKKNDHDDSKKHNKKQNNDDNSNSNTQMNDNTLNPYSICTMDGITKIMNWMKKLQKKQHHHHQQQQQQQQSTVEYDNYISIIQSAVEYDLIKLKLQPTISNSSSSTTITSNNNNNTTPTSKTKTNQQYSIKIQIYITTKAYTICSPMSIGQVVLSKSMLNRCKKKMKPIYEYAMIFQSLVVDSIFLFSSTPISTDFRTGRCDVNHKRGRGNRENVVEENNVITSKMVYNAIDNVHLNTDNEETITPTTLTLTNTHHPQNNDNNDQQQQQQQQDELKINGLVPTLRNYQQAAVNWMVEREHGNIEDHGWEICWLIITDMHTDSDGGDCGPSAEIEIETPSITAAIDAPVIDVDNDNEKCPPNDDDSKCTKVDTNADDTSSTLITYKKNVYTLFEWKKKSHQTTIILDNDDDYDDCNTIFYNPITGWLVQNYDEAKKYTLNEENEGDSIIRGGILAESMGLGKTVELLACILKNPCPESYIRKQKEFRNIIPIEQTEKDNTNMQRNGNLDRQPLSESDQCAPLSYACYCGRSESKFSLAYVKCSRCGQIMHGACAGYMSQEDLVSNSLAGEPRICDERHCLFCQHQLGQSNSHGLIGSRATLIVTPPSILNQWEREIRRHTSLRDINVPNSLGRPLKVIVYPGIKAICSSSHGQATQSNIMQLLQPYHLADADVVLTTFDTLRGELGHCSDNPFVGSRKMRIEKKYRVVPSPLVSINWWRICLDEAQRIETPTAASAKMVLNLVSQNKWCVSGTPIGRGKMDDLFGLYLFLNAKPFCYKQCFNTYLKPKFCDITNRIKHSTFDLMWRSTKANESVRIQMGIPEQVEKKTILKFSSVERHFYERQLENTLLAASTAMMGRGKKARKKITDDLSIHLHRLRAACCHPQVGSSGISKVARKKTKVNQTNGTSVANGVLNMAQILDRLIDDAKVKAEESQRVFTLHTNALACVTRLKAEAQKNGSISSEDDELYLLRKCCDFYFEALEEANNNSTPGTIIGEAILTGCNGFQSQNTCVRDGAATLFWRIRQADDESSNCEVLPEMWSRFDFTGPMKKINSFVVRPCTSDIHSDINNNSNQIILFPKDCVLQVSNAAMGGMFVDAIPFTLSCPDEQTAPQSIEWQQFTGVRPNKSKSWRIVVKNYHDQTLSDVKNDAALSYFIGLEVQLMEPNIAYDNLQRMHILHNISLSLSTLSQKMSLSPSKERNQIDGGNLMYSLSNIQKHIDEMREESHRLELHYIEAARIIQQVSDEKLNENVKKRKEILSELNALSNDSEKLWSEELLIWCHLYGSIQLQQSVCAHVERRLFELFDDPSQTFRRRSFPEFSNIDGLNFALSLKLESTFHCELVVPDCISRVKNLSAHPSEGEVLENSQCRKCRADWDQRGPLCQCCIIEEDLIEYEGVLKEAEINCVLQAIAEWFDGNLARLKKVKKTSIDESANFNLSNIHKRMEKFFLFKTAALKELEIARRKWRTHFNLLSDIDELNQCKRAMRLSYEKENLFELTEQEKAFIVQPCDIATLIMDHISKQAMAQGNLRRSKESLRFLKNQNINVKDGDDDKCCAICLTPFGNDRAVLRCGHMFHYSPCMEKLLSRGGGNTITCPMRCVIRTRKEDILIASEESNDDGSKTNRTIQGCWGTKIDRLIADLMDVVERGEKSIIFSQWDDMLSIMEHAFMANEIQYIRPKAIKKFGEDMKLFRTKNCHVLLMHVKHGAEGLTLVEANHIFMIEPLLNHSVDSQAINRIHRIGQIQKTYVHRYLISDTIEIKIDKIRVERQENNPDGDEGISVLKGNKQKDDEICVAGGFDGGFNEAELQEFLH